MLSSRWVSFWTLICGVLFLFMSSCGLFGKREKLDQIVEFAPEALSCFEGAGEKVSQYIDGTVDINEWAALWDCGIDVVELLKQFVKGSQEEGYSPDDIYYLITKLMIQDQKIAREFVGSLFEMKASLFGGDIDSLKHAELDAVVELIEVMKRETLILHPHFVMRAQRPEPSEMYKLIDAVGISSKKIGDILNIQDAHFLSRSALRKFLRGLKETVSGADIDLELVDFMVDAKNLLINGDPDGFKSGEWSRVIDIGAHLGSLVLAMDAVDSDDLNRPNEDGIFMLEMLGRLVTILNRSIEWHGGRWLYSQVDQVLSTMPSDWLRPKEDCRFEDCSDVDGLKEAVSGTLRTLFSTLFPGQYADGVDSKNLASVISRMKEWTVAQTHLEKIFRLGGLDVQGVERGTFVSVANRYASGLSTEEREQVRWLVRGATKFSPLFEEGADQIKFTDIKKYSLNDLSRKIWMRISAREVIRNFSNDDPSHRRLSLKDVRIFVERFSDIIFELRLMDPDIPKIADKRFQEADLFTFASNGDGWISSNELTYYVAILSSIGALKIRVRDGISPPCQIVNSKGKKRRDRLNFPWMEVQCFRKEYYGNIDQYWDHLPKLKKHFEGVDENSKKLLMVSLENASRLNLCSARPIAGYDSGSYSGVIHYVEAMFQRFDTNRDDLIHYEESKAAFKVFFNTIKEVAQSQSPIKLKKKQIEGVFTYLLSFGVTPNALQLVYWVEIAEPLGEWKRLVRGDRTVIYQVLANLALAKADEGKDSRFKDPFCEPPPEPVLK